MEMYFVLTGLIVFSLAFVMWLAMFLLSRGINTNLETDAESRRIATRQLVAGVLLFTIAVGLGLYFRQMDRPELIPKIGPGLTVAAPMVQEVIDVKAMPTSVDAEVVESAITEDSPNGEREIPVEVESDNLQPITQ